ncbi:MAG TPA: hypothetical protein VNZ64_00940 [Candidatus Acidoferrum sp.]|nr:hypothetical protein [Candidatus Acidoferrum sp.]
MTAFVHLLPVANRQLLKQREVKLVARERVFLPGVVVLVVLLRFLLLLKTEQEEEKEDQDR